MCSLADSLHAVCLKRVRQEPTVLCSVLSQSPGCQLTRGNGSVSLLATLSGSALTLHTPLVVCPLASLTVPAACPLPALKTPGDPDVRTAAASASSPLDASAFCPELPACACMPQPSHQPAIRACLPRLHVSGMLWS